LPSRLQRSPIVVHSGRGGRKAARIDFSKRVVTLRLRLTEFPRKESVRIVQQPIPTHSRGEALRLSRKRPREPARDKLLQQVRFGFLVQLAAFPCREPSQ